MSMEEEIPPELTSVPEAVEKYHAAGQVVSQVMLELIGLVAPNVNIAELCARGDLLVEEACKTKFPKKKWERGAAFPTCVCVNHCVEHYSPTPGDTSEVPAAEVLEQPVTLNVGDLVKITIGAQFDGMASVSTNSTVVPGGAVPITGRVADAVCAAHFASQIALRLLRPGYNAKQLTEAIDMTAADFKCQALTGIRMHEQHQNALYSEDHHILGSEPDPESGEVYEDFQFEANQVYNLNVLISTGEGNHREGPTKSTVFRRTENVALLKIKAGRQLLNDVKKYKDFPFALRNTSDARRAKVGLGECVEKEVLERYPVTYERQGEFVAQFRFTVLLLGGSIQPIGTCDALPHVNSDFGVVTPQLKAWQQLGLKRKAANKKRKKKSKAAASGDMDTSAE